MVNFPSRIQMPAGAAAAGCARVILAGFLSGLMCNLPISQGPERRSPSGPVLMAFRCLRLRVQIAQAGRSLAVRSSAAHARYGKASPEIQAVGAAAARVAQRVSLEAAAAFGSDFQNLPPAVAIPQDAVQGGCSWPGGDIFLDLHEKVHATLRPRHDHVNRRHCTPRGTARMPERHG